jgi:hypothetical protein
MNKKLLLIPALVVGILLLLVGEYFLINKYVCKDTQADTTTPQAMMLLIEFQNTDGLVNMVNDMKERNVKGLLMVSGRCSKRDFKIWSRRTCTII